MRRNNEKKIGKYHMNAQDTWAVEMEDRIFHIQALAKRMGESIDDEMADEQQISFDLIKYAVDDAETTYLAKPVEASE